MKIDITLILSDTVSVERKHLYENAKSKPNVSDFHPEILNGQQGDRQRMLAQSCAIAPRDSQSLYFSNRWHRGVIVSVLGTDPQQMLNKY